MFGLIELILTVTVMIAIVIVVLAYVMMRRTGSMPEEAISAAPSKKRRPQLALLEQAGGLRELIEAGRDEEAAELYRQFAGVDLFSARDAIAELREIMEHGDPLDGELLELVRAGRKIHAIKLYREATGEGLAESKAYVDALERAAQRAANAPPRLQENASAADEDDEEDETLYTRRRVSRGPRSE